MEWGWGQKNGGYGTKVNSMGCSMNRKGLIKGIENKN